MNLLKTYIKIIFISLIFFLYLSEYYLTFVLFEGGSQNKKNLDKKVTLFKKQTGKNYDTRSKVDVYRKFLEIEDNIAVTLQPVHKTNENYLYLSGISKAKTINCNENGFYSTYISDRYGFNNEDQEWDSKEFEFVVVGDSLVMGSCVNRPDDITSVLKKLSQKSAVNLGFVGNGPLSQYASLVEYLPKKTKNILWIYSEHTDLEDLNSEIKNENLIPYLYDKNFSFDLKFKQKEIDNFHRKKIEDAMKDINNNDEYWNSFYSNKKIFLRFIRLNKLKSTIIPILKKGDKKEDDNNLAFNKFEKVLILANELATKNGSKLYFVYIGSYYRYKHFIFNSNKNFKNYSRVINLVKNLNIPIIDTHKDFFSKQQNALKYFPFESYGHFNSLGYKKISELIYDNITK